VKTGNRLKSFILVLVIALLSVNSISAEDGSGKIINMHFKGADIRDVLQTISELAQVNLVTDGSVQGDITINLKDLSFDQALKLITQTYGLGYVWDGNTIVVATPERIEEIYACNEVEIVKLFTASAQHVQGVVSGVYPELNIMADEVNNQLILAGNKQLINDARALIDKLDVSDNIQTRTLQVDYIDTKVLVENIQKIYPDLLLTADEVNGLVIVKGKKEQVSAAINLIQGMDRPGSEVTTELKVRYIEPFILMEKIKEVIPELQIEEDEQNSKLVLKGSKEEINRALALARELDVEEKKALEIMTVDYADLTEIEGIITEFFPDVKVKLNNQNRELIIHGYKDEVEDALKLLKGLDTPRKQVLIEARIEEISTTALEEMGINANELSTIKFLTDDNNVVNGVALTWPEILKVLERNGEAQTLANPRLLTLSGEEARLLIGDKIPVELAEGEDKTRIEYIDAGITLIFRPWVSSDGRITLDVNPKISSIGEAVYGGLPAINTREAETKVRLKDGQTFAIGGLIQDDIVENISQVPLLADIPIFGKIFEHRDKNHIKTEVIIFITPHIVDDQLVNIDKEKVGETLQDNTSGMVQEDLQSSPEDGNNGDSANYIDSTATAVIEERVINEVRNKDNKEETTYKIAGLTDEELVALLGLEPEEEETEAEDSPAAADTIPKENIDNSTDRVEDNTEDGNKEIEESKPEHDAEEIDADPGDDSIIDENVSVTLDLTENTDEMQQNQEEVAEHYLIDYLVKEGEDINIVAGKFGIAKESILSFNKVNSVASGMVLTIPVPETHLYTLKKGETLWRVHQKFNVDLQLLTEINNIEDYTNLPVGKILVLPKAISE